MCWHVTYLLIRVTTNSKRHSKIYFAAIWKEVRGLMARGMFRSSSQPPFLRPSPCSPRALLVTYGIVRSASGSKIEENDSAPGWYNAFHSAAPGVLSHTLSF